MAQQVAEKMEFPKEEEKVLQFWKDVDAFKTCLEQSKNKKKYDINFYYLNTTYFIKYCLFILKL